MLLKEMVTTVKLSPQEFTAMATPQEFLRITTCCDFNAYVIVTHEQQTT